MELVIREKCTKLDLACNKYEQIRNIQKHRKIWESSLFIYINIHFVIRRTDSSVFIYKQLSFLISLL